MLLAQRIVQGSAGFPPKADPPLAGSLPNFVVNSLDEMKNFMFIVVYYFQGATGIDLAL